MVTLQQYMSRTKRFTVFVQQADGRGTTYICGYSAVDPVDAKDQAIIDCSREWSYPQSDLRILGVAEGDVNILEWDDCDE